MPASYTIYSKFFYKDNRQIAKMFFYPTGLVALLLAGKSLMENYKAGHDVEKDPTTTIDEVQNLMARQLQLRKMGVAEHESSSREE